MNLNKQYSVRNNSYVVNKLKQKQDELLHISRLKKELEKVKKYFLPITCLSLDYPQSLKDKDCINLVTKSMSMETSHHDIRCKDRAIINYITGKSEKYLQNLITETVGIELSSLDFALSVFYSKFQHIEANILDSSRGMGELIYLFWNMNDYSCDGGQIKKIQPITKNRNVDLVNKSKHVKDPYSFGDLHGDLYGEKGRLYGSDFVKSGGYKLDRIFFPTSTNPDFTLANAVETFRETFYDFEMNGRYVSGDFINSAQMNYALSYWRVIKEVMSYIPSKLLGCPLVHVIVEAISAMMANYLKDKIGTFYFGQSPRNLYCDDSKRVKNSLYSIGDQNYCLATSTLVSGFEDILNIINTIPEEYFHKFSLCYDAFQATKREETGVFHWFSQRRYLSSKAEEAMSRITTYMAFHELLVKNKNSADALKYYNFDLPLSFDHDILQLNCLGMTTSSFFLSGLNGLHDFSQGNDFLSVLLDRKNIANYVDYDVAFERLLWLIQSRQQAQLLDRKCCYLTRDGEKMTVTLLERELHKSNTSLCRTLSGSDNNNLFSHITEATHVLFTCFKGGYKGRYSDVAGNYEDMDRSLIMGLLYFWLCKYKNWYDGDTSVMLNNYPQEINNHEVLNLYRMRLASAIADFDKFKTLLPENINVHPKDFFSDLISKMAKDKQDSMIERYGEDVKFPELPESLKALDSSKWKHLDSAYSLVVEGSRMRHCVGGEDYIDAALDGDMLFHYDDGSIHGLTICLKMVQEMYPVSNSDDIKNLKDVPKKIRSSMYLFEYDEQRVSQLYEIDQIRGRYNSDPDDETIETIKAELKSCCLMDKVLRTTAVA